MALNLEAKKQVVAEVAEAAARASSAIAADYHGLTVAELTRLRRQAGEQDVWLRVVKNTLARRALSGTPFACMTESLRGPLILAFSHDNPGAAAKLIRDFQKESEDLEVKILAFDGELQDLSGFERLASLPTYEQAIGLLMAVMKAPVEKLVRTLAAPASKLVRTVAALRGEKQKSA